MNQIRSMILCEGDSDQVLLGSYLSEKLDIEFNKRIKEDPFPGEKIAWYFDNNDRLIGIWNAEGCDFVPNVKKIMQRELIEHVIDSIVIVTDYDDEKSSTDRPENVYKAICETVKIDNKDSKGDFSVRNNIWTTIEFEGSFSEEISIRYCYLLVPYDAQGALETFMLKALSEDNETKKETILQVKDFVKNFKSDQYLKKRRERIKAELGISVSIFNPERMFDTMMELINRVDWSKFDETEKQFGLLREV